MTAHRVWLPFPPSVNNLFSQGMVRGKVRRFPSSSYRRWRKQALMLLMVARLPHMTGHVAIRLTLTPPSSARRDVDNYSKAVLDALVEARVLADDSQVQKLLAVWDHAGEQPGAIIEIGPAEASRPSLTTPERQALGKLRRAGYRLVSPNKRTPSTTRSLIEKGYVREIPGLIDGCPQGFEAVD